MRRVLHLALVLALLGAPLAGLCSPLPQASEPCAMQNCAPAGAAAHGCCCAERRDPATPPAGDKAAPDPGPRALSAPPVAQASAPEPGVGHAGSPSRMPRPTGRFVPLFLLHASFLV